MTNRTVEHIAEYFPDMTVVAGKGGLSKVLRNGTLTCIDDRRIESVLLPVGEKVSKEDRLGYKSPGAAFGAAYLMALTRGIKNIDSPALSDLFWEIKDAGVTVGVHDISPLRCAHAGEVLSGGFDDKIRVDLNSDRILRVLEQVGGRHLKLQGSHNPNSTLRINLRQGHTFEQTGNGYTFDAPMTIGLLGVAESIAYNNLHATARMLGISQVQVYE